MLFDPVALFIFLPVVLAGFHILARRQSAVAWGWLTTASALYWFATSGWSMVGALALALVNFGIARKVMALPAARLRRRRGLTLAGILMALVPMTFGKLLQAGTPVCLVQCGGGFETILPLGFSFFALRQISFLIDVHRRTVIRADIGDYLLFVCFFPCLATGPLIRFRELAPQTARPQNVRCNPDDFAVGLSLIAIGMIKKLWIADPLGRKIGWAMKPEVALSTPSFAGSWAAAIGVTLWIYFDFSASWDLAAGSARMFGIRLPLNFQSPVKWMFKPTEFWRRWHMSMMRLMRDYLFLPLFGWLNRRIGGRPGGKAAAMAGATLVTFETMGLWHGFHEQYALWGLLQGGCLAFYQWRQFRQAGRNEQPDGALLSRLLLGGATFGWLVMCDILFISAIPEQAAALLGGMAGLNDVLLPAQPGDAAIFDPRRLLVEPRILLYVLGAGLVACFLPNTAEWLAPHSPALERVAPPGGLFARLVWRRDRRWAVATGLLLWIAIVGLIRHQAEAYVYIRF